MQNMRFEIGENSRISTFRVRENYSINKRTDLICIHPKKPLKT